MSWTTKPARPGWYWWRNPYVTGSDIVQQYLQLYLDGPYWGDWWHEPLTPPWEHPEPVNGELLAALRALIETDKVHGYEFESNEPALYAKIVAAIARAASLPDSARMRDALERIARWHGEFPATGKFWDKEKTMPMSFDACFGSNGERDYMRELARAALEGAPK